VDLQFWGFLWFVISFIFFGLAILAGILLVSGKLLVSMAIVYQWLISLEDQFHQTLKKQYKEAARFLPTWELFYQHASLYEASSLGLERQGASAVLRMVEGKEQGKEARKVKKRHKRRMHLATEDQS
jgi:hypothetical protein